MAKEKLSTKAYLKGYTLEETGELTVSFALPKEERLNNILVLESQPFHERETLQLTAYKYREKRSINANDYLWTLCDEISQSLENDGLYITKEEIYKNHIRKVGVYAEIALKTDAVDSFQYAWESKGIGWQIETVDDEPDGMKKCFAYYGSSTYDTKEMSRLLNSVIEDARSLDIDIKPKEELDYLIEEWRKLHERKS